jgi:hypothetical protein
LVKLLLLYRADIIFYLIISSSSLTKKEKGKKQLSGWRLFAGACDAMRRRLGRVFVTGLD